MSFEATDLNNTYNYISTKTFINSFEYFLDLSNITIEEGKYLDNSGNVQSSGAFMLSDYISIPSTVQYRSLYLNRIVYTATGVPYTRSRMAWFYDENQELMPIHRYIYHNDSVIEEFVPIKARYVRVNFSRYIVPAYIGISTFKALVGTNCEIQQMGIDDANDLPANSIFLRSNGDSTGQILKNKPNPTFVGQIITTNNYNYNRSGTFQLAISSLNELYVRRSWNNTNTFNVWTRFSSVETDCKLLFDGDYTFTSAQQTIKTTFVLKANSSYDIRIVGHTGIINVFGLGNTDNYKGIRASMNQLSFDNDDTDRYLELYNYDGTLDTVRVLVYDQNKSVLHSSNQIKTYIVNKNRPVSADYTSFTQCLLDLKDDVDEKIIVVYGGDYNIYQEYQDAGVPVYAGTNPIMDYFDYCVWVPKNTHIIGKGIVRLKWMPDPEEHPEMTVNQCCCVSPLNVAPSCTIENIEVHCKNGRYCLHNDALGKGYSVGAKQLYKDVKFYKYVNDTDSSGTAYGFGQTIGFGIDSYMHHIYENCTFINYGQGRAFYGHSRGTVDGHTVYEYSSSNITVTNCIINTEGPVAVKLGNGTSPYLHIRVNFNSCYINNRINIINESGSESLPNAYDVTFLNCNDISVHISDINNKYPIQHYNTNITEIP